jgi:hypothetical protein
MNAISTAIVERNVAASPTNSGELRGARPFRVREELHLFEWIVAVSQHDLRNVTVAGLDSKAR